MTVDPGGVEGDRQNIVPVHAGRLDGEPRGLGQRIHVRGMGLRGKIRILPVAEDGILRYPMTDRPARAVDDRHTDTLRSKVYAGNN